jgi:hypothetical protein
MLASYFRKFGIPSYRHESNNKYTGDLPVKHCDLYRCPHPIRNQTSLGAGSSAIMFPFQAPGSARVVINDQASQPSVSSLPSRGITPMQSANEMQQDAMRRDAYNLPSQISFSSKEMPDKLTAMPISHPR